MHFSLNMQLRHLTPNRLLGTGCGSLSQVLYICVALNHSEYLGHILGDYPNPRPPKSKENLP